MLRLFLLALLVSITYGKANYIVHIVDLLDSRFQLPTVKWTIMQSTKASRKQGKVSITYGKANYRIAIFEELFDARFNYLR